MTDRLRFQVPGVPKGKGRPRAAPYVEYEDGRPVAKVRLLTPKDTVAAERAIREAFRARYPDHRQWTGPIMLRFTAVFPIPKGWPRALKEAARRGEVYHTAKPDKDNIEKLVADALNLKAWMDDAQVQGGGVKRYGEPARLEVELIHLRQPALPITPSEKRRRERAANPELPMAPGERRKSSPTKSQSRKVPPDLSGYPPSVRARIEDAMAREDADRAARRR